MPENNFISSAIIGGYSPSRTNVGSTSSQLDLSMLSEKVTNLAEQSAVNISTGNWIALTDTMSDSRTITLAQVEDNLLSDIISKLEQLKTLSEDIGDLEIDSFEFDTAMESFDALESELSLLIGLSTIRKTGTVLADSNDGEFSIRNTGSYVESLELVGADGSITELAMIEISDSDFLNGFHVADSCPICRAEAMSAASGTALNSSGTQTDVPTPSAGPSTLGSYATGMTSQTATGTNYIDSLMSGYIWDIEAGESLTYSFFDSGVGLSSAESGWSGYELGDQEDNMRIAYETWDLYLPFSLDEVDESGTTVGDLRAMYNDNTSANTASGSAAQGAYPWNSAAGGNAYYHVVISNGAIDEAATSAANLGSNLDFSVGTYGFYTALHEIGHTLGWKHPFGTGTVLPDADEDVRNTVMAYSSVDDIAVSYDGSSWATSSLLPITPMVYDIAIVEEAYGDVTDANATDTTFTYTNPNLIQTIIDSGGTDTIDVSGMEQRSIIDLTPGAYSSIGYWTQSEQVDYYASTYGFSTSSLTTFFNNYDTVSSVAGISNSTVKNGGVYERQNNLGIAYSAVIENVIGSNGADQITGNNANNQITGGQGNDVINGGSGTDQAIFSGRYSEYSITDNGDGSYTVVDSESGRDGTDTISNVERFTFSDSFYDVSSGTQAGDENYRGGSNGGGISNVYYSAFNRINFSSSIMSNHQVAQLKQLMFHSVGDVSKLIEEALKTFTQQRASLDSVLASFSTTGEVPMASSTNQSISRSSSQNMTDLASEIRQAIVEQVAEALTAQANTKSEPVAAILA